MPASKAWLGRKTAQQPRQPARRAVPVLARKMFDALGDSATGRIIANTFACMEIVEEEILVAQKRWPIDARIIDKVFGIACPTPFILGKTEAVYQHHVRELIDRLREGEVDMKPATKAEVLCSILAGSLAAPPQHRYVHLAQALWAEVMPGKPVWAKADEEWETRREFKQDRSLS